MREDMAVEIERKFLVRDDSWRGLFTHASRRSGTG
jgi:CYTH domain-containing protein